MCSKAFKLHLLHHRSKGTAQPSKTPLKMCDTNMYLHVKHAGPSHVRTQYNCTSMLECCEKVTTVYIVLMGATGPTTCNVTIPTATGSNSVHVATATYILPNMVTCIRATHTSNNYTCTYNYIATAYTYIIITTCAICYRSYMYEYVAGTHFSRILQPISAVGKEYDNRWQRRGLANHLTCTYVYNTYMYAYARLPCMHIMCVCMCT